MQCLHQTRPFFLAERVPEFKQFCHLSLLPPIRSNRSLGPARRSSCLPEDALPHAWVGSPYAGRVAPLVGRPFLPTWADIPPHTWEISLTRKTGHPLQAGAPLSRSQRTSRASCWHQLAWRWKHDPSCTVPKDQTLSLQTKFSHIFVCTILSIQRKNVSTISSKNLKQHLFWKILQMFFFPWNYPNDTSELMAPSVGSLASKPDITKWNYVSFHGSLYNLN